MFAQIRDRIAALLAQRDEFGKFCTGVYLKLSHHTDMLGLELHVAGYDDLLGSFPSVRDTHGAAELAERILERWLREHAEPTKTDQERSESEDAPI